MPIREKDESRVEYEPEEVIVPSGQAPPPSTIVFPSLLLMPHLLDVSLKQRIDGEAHAFPFNVPAIRTLERLELAPVTFFVGENGSGKSTLLEAIASAAELRSLGGADTETDDTLAQQRRLARMLRLAWRPRSREGFFMRAEDYSPILLALPEARIFSFDAAPIAKVRYEDLEHVTVTRDFLINPQSFLKHLRE